MRYLDQAADVGFAYHIPLGYVLRGSIDPESPSHAYRWVLVAINGLASATYSLLFSYLVLFAQRGLGLDSSGYGLMMSFSALGGLMGSFVAPRLSRRFGYGTGVVMALLLGAVSIAACGFTSNPFIAAVALAAYICHAVVWNVLAGTVRQKIVPQELLGRTGSAGRLVGYLGLAAAAIAARLHGSIHAGERAQDDTAVPA